MNREEKELDLVPPYAFVDGSFHIGTGMYGYGGFVHTGDKKIPISGCGNEPDLASMRNIAGEIGGAMEAVRVAMSEGLKELTIYYDYNGIEMWAMGTWRTNRLGTAKYAEFMRKAMETIDIRFVHVKGHSGIPGNEEADRLAKNAVGISIDFEEMDR